MAGHQPIARDDVLWARARRRLTALRDWMDRRWGDTEEWADAWSGYCW